MKVLIVAPNASAKFGGEAILPLHYFTRLPAVGVDTYMIVHERTRPELETLLGDRFCNVSFVTDTQVHKFLWRCSTFFPERIRTFTFGFLLSLLTQFEQRKIARKLIKEIGIDIVHVPIQVSPKLPSVIHSLGVPVVIGPLNGGMEFPPAFKHLQGFLERNFTVLARATSDVINRIFPGKRRATTLLVANERTRRALPGTRAHVEIFVENGVDLSLFSSNLNSNAAVQKDITFIFIGRLVDWKCVDILLEAAALVRKQSCDFRLEIIGDGIEYENLRKLSKKLYIDDIVQFRGFLPQIECAKYLSKCCCLVLPSVYECGGAVVLEAMAMAKPTIASNWGGPADYLDQDTGILIEPGPSRECFTKSFADAMLKLAQERELCLKLGKSAYQRVVQKYAWSKKVHSMKKIYIEANQRYRQTNVSAK